MKLTGNPFVDTGLMTITALAGAEKLEHLDFSTVDRVFGDGRELAKQNLALKCFTMVFGTNGPLTQPAYKKAGKNQEIYISILRQLLDVAKTEGNAGPRCDLTGIRTDLDFHAVCAKALSGAGVAVPDQKWLGRDWVPLGGSLGNDAQALPVASRPLQVSALAVFALQYLPMGVFLFKGKLGCFQSTSEEFSQVWVANIVDQNKKRLALGDTEIIGKKGGTGWTLKTLLSCFDNVSLKPGTEAALWQFSNSGAGADCSVDEIPDSALAFIANARTRFMSEIRGLIDGESGDSRQQLFECIRGLRDYSGLYSYKKHNGASAEFYEFYQTEIMKADMGQLNLARKLADLMKKGEGSRRLKEICKPEFLRSIEGKTLARKYVIAHFSVGEYDRLFPSEHHPIRTGSSAWNYLGYYLTTPLGDRRPIAEMDLVMKTTHPKIVHIAETYRTVEPRKIKDVLDRMARRDIGVRWLQDKFCRLAEKHEDWNLGDWDEFACDEDGKVVTFELLFQLRLYLSNLYREVAGNTKGEAA